MEYRIEKDSLGEVKVPGDVYYGAQTQRSLNNFKIGTTKMPLEIIYAHALIKKACACANNELGILNDEKCKYISSVCAEIIKGNLDDHFPLVVYQTGSGTQTNMNLNEVIANRAHVLSGGLLGKKNSLLHPNDDVNKSQSTNDTFPSSLHLSVHKVLVENTLKNLEELRKSLDKKSKLFGDIVKIGRTHFMDATPITLGQVFSGYSFQVKDAIECINCSLDHLRYIPIGGTAVGTGLNAPKGFDKTVITYINKFSGFKFKASKNKFAHMGGKDALCEVSGALKIAAVALMKIGNDIRMLGSGPRCGIGELILPANEPGSSIMPGKINPTQSEALTQVCAQVLGNDLATTIGASNGQFELNVFMPLIGYNLINSAKLIGDSVKSFTINCINGIKPNKDRINMHLENSLMLVTALNSHIGYENSAKIAKKAYEENKTLKQSCLELGLLDELQFDKIVNPIKMV